MFSVTMLGLSLSPCNNLFIIVGVVFDSLGDNIEYTIRPAHEVKAEDDEPTWRTDIVQPRFQAPGPRVSPK